ncbi:MAG: hypothetical protein C3F11_14930 [Methylocystaceae bacterium]|nr:MAG: hypothetical protein C3F11_14930 [Methylocystaceae bacterium]
MEIDGVRLLALSSVDIVVASMSLGVQIGQSISNARSWSKRAGLYGFDVSPTKIRSFSFGFTVAFLFIVAPLPPARAQAPDYLMAQRVLKQRGFDIGPANGRWGQRSIKALREFQQWEGLTPNGTLDPATARRLRELAAPEPAKAVTLPPLPIVPSHRVVPPAQSIPVEAQMAPSPNGAVPPAAPLPSFGTLNVGSGSRVDHSSKPSEVATSALRTSATAPAEARAWPTWLVFASLAILGVGLFWAMRRRQSNSPIESPPQPRAAVCEPEAKRSATRDPRSESSVTSDTGLQLSEIQSISNAVTHNSTVGERIKAYETALEAALDATLTCHVTPRAEEIVSEGIAIETLDEKPRPMATSRPNDVSRLFPSSRPGEWMPPGQPVMICGRKIDQGMIYFGRSLPRRGGGGDENCLINPDLEVAARSDRSGSALSYWPAYAQLTPSLRATYLDWLVGPRCDPATDIGFVFLYFYGLERRLMLDTPGEGRAAVVAEVRRLLEIFGGNHSFRRYATTLLAVDAARSADVNAPPAIDFCADNGETPLALRIALGVRARDGRAIESDLLLAFVMTHPETRVRTPARRALPELRLLFKATVEKEFPDGLKFLRAGRARRLEALYEAASGTFVSEMLPKDHGLPDVMRLSEPLATARRLFDACSSQLDAYSRELSRANGLEPNLNVLSRLPVELRSVIAEALPDAPLSALADFAAQNAPVDPELFARRLRLADGAPTEIGQLREWARVIGAFGYGMTSDPFYTLRRPAPEAPFVVFELGAPEEARTSLSETFRTTQMMVSLGVMVALADGVFLPEERDALANLIESAPDLQDVERRRLRAELAMYAVSPMSLADLRARLKRAPPETRRQLGADIIRMAAVDGRIEPKEIAFIETLFRQLDLDKSDLYGRLHGAVSAREEPRQQDNASSVGSLASSGLDLRRLAAIRAETAGAASMLSEIFADEDAEASAPSTAPANPAEPLVDDLEGFDGLDGRHRSLLQQLCDRDEWPRADFEHLVRSVQLMPGAALEALNDWALDRFDDLLLEGDEPIVVNTHLLSLNVRQAAI